MAAERTGIPNRYDENSSHNAFASVNLILVKTSKRTHAVSAAVAMSALLTASVAAAEPRTNCLEEPREVTVSED